MSAAWLKAPPSVGDFVWCHFPQETDGSPGPKPRPALVMRVTTRTDGTEVTVAYGTSKRVTALKSGEFAISKLASPEAYRLAGLSYDSKFNLKETAVLPWTESFFKVPPLAPRGQTPRLGTLHASLVRAAEAAFRAANLR